MADICDFTQDNGVPSTGDVQDAAVANRNGELSDADLQTIEDAWSATQPIDGCAVGDQPPDESQPRVELGRVWAGEPNTIITTYTVFNDVVSGNGETLNVKVEWTIDGETTRTETHTIEPYGSVNGRFSSGRISAGTRDVCVNLV